MIISLLASYLHDPEQDIKGLLNCYPVMSQTDSKGVTKSEIMNKYFVMFGDKPPTDRNGEEIVYVQFLLLIMHRAQIQGLCFPIFSGPRDAGVSGAMMSLFTRNQSKI